MKFAGSAIINNRVSWRLTNPKPEEPDLYIKLSSTRLNRRTMMLLYTTLTHCKAMGDKAPAIVYPMSLPIDICKEDNNKKLSGQYFTLTISHGIVTVRVPWVSVGYCIELNTFIEGTRQSLNSMGVSLNSMGVHAPEEGENDSNWVIHKFQVPHSAVEHAIGVVNMDTISVMLLNSKEGISVGVVVMPIDGTTEPWEIQYKTSEPTIQLVKDDDGIYKPGRIQR